MKILSWNVNGIRAAVKKGFAGFLAKEKPDIVLLQETKISDSAREREIFDFPGYDEYWHSAVRPGYSGTAALVKSYKVHQVCKVEGIVNGIGNEEFDNEGRVQTLELGKFFLVNCYFPNAGEDLKRLEYKIAFNRALRQYIQRLEKKKPVIIGGDFNVAHNEIDIARPKENTGNAGFTAEERRGMDEFIRSGLVDTFRHFHPDQARYSWWSYRFRAREKNIGWRIDYFLVSGKMIKKVDNAEILDKIQGSDHCPVGVEIVF